MDPVLQVVKIKKQFAGVRALDGVDFDLLPGEVHALMGENGAGKSTLINIISGLIRPTSGSVFLEGREVHFNNSMDAKRAGISTITQEFNLVPQLTVAENIFLGREPVHAGGLIDWKTIRERAERTLAVLGLDVGLNQRVEYLDVGDRQLIEIAKALSGDFRVIMMDEPTAALNAAEVDRLFEIIGTLKKQGVAVLYVSHRLNEVFRIADRITVLRDGARVATRSLAGLHEDDVVTMMLGRSLARQAAVVATTDAGKRTALSVRDLSVAGALRDVSFDLSYGEVLGCAGLIGSGRFELLRTLFGLQQRSGGDIKIEGRPAALRNPQEAIRAGVAMLAEDRKTEGIFPDLEVLENLMITSATTKERKGKLLIDTDDEQKQYQEMRDLLDIKAFSPRQLITKLSGGNQQKVMIGRALVSKSRILLLNEPTRGVDVGTKMEIHALIRRLVAQGFAFLVSSSDVPELVAVSDRCMVFSAGRMTGTLAKEQITEDTITALAIGRGIMEENGHEQK
jgi:ABC-type sugar transport system ATPase subunit